MKVLIGIFFVALMYWLISTIYSAGYWEGRKDESEKYLKLLKWKNENIEKGKTQ